jgi:hypothetical protein
MSCSCCAIDYDKLGKEIDAGRMEDVERAVAELAGEDLYLRDGVVIYCPGCQAAIARLKERVAARLRHQTLDGIQELMGRARDTKNKNLKAG